MAEEAEDIASEDNQINWREHIPLIITVISVTFICIRILSVAKYNVETGFGILQYGGTASVLVGVVISTIGLVSPLIAMLCFMSSITLHAESRKIERHALTLVGAFFSITSFFLTPVAYLIIVALVGFIIAGLIALKSKRSDRKVAEVIARDDTDEIQETVRRLELKLARAEIRQKRLDLFALIYSGIILAGIGLNTSPWLPAEQLDFTNGQPPLAVYVLSTSDSEYILLNAYTRQIEFLRADIIKSRTLCVPNPSLLERPFILPSLNQPLPTLISSGPKYKDCPEP